MDYTSKIADFKNQLAQMRKLYAADGNISAAEQQDLDELETLIAQAEEKSARVKSGEKAEGKEGLQQTLNASTTQETRYYTFVLKDGGRIKLHEGKPLCAVQFTVTYVKATKEEENRSAWGIESVQIATPTLPRGVKTTASSFIENFADDAFNIRANCYLKVKLEGISKEKTEKETHNASLSGNLKGKLSGVLNGAEGSIGFEAASGLESSSTYTDQEGTIEAVYKITIVSDAQQENDDIPFTFSAHTTEGLINADLNIKRYIIDGLQGDDGQPDMIAGLMNNIGAVSLNPEFKAEEGQ